MFKFVREKFQKGNNARLDDCCLQEDCGEHKEDFPSQRCRPHLSWKLDFFDPMHFLNLYSKPLDALNLSHSYSLFDRWGKVKTVISEAAEVTIGKKP